MKCELRQTAVPVVRRHYTRAIRVMHPCDRAEITLVDKPLCCANVRDDVQRRHHMELSAVKYG